MESLKEFIDKTLKENIIFHGPMGSGKEMFPKTIPAAVDKPCSMYLKKKDRTQSLEQLLDNGVIEQQQLIDLRNAFENNENILITGRIGSGKTTLFRSLLSDKVTSDLNFGVVEHFPNLNASKEEQRDTYLKNYLVLTNASREIIRTVYSDLNKHCIDSFFKHLKEGKSVIAIGYDSTEFYDMLTNYDSCTREKYSFLEVHMSHTNGFHKLNLVPKRII